MTLLQPFSASEKSPANAFSQSFQRLLDHLLAFEVEPKMLVRYIIVAAGKGYLMYSNACSLLRPTDPAIVILPYLPLLHVLTRQPCVPVLH